MAGERELGGSNKLLPLAPIFLATGMNWMNTPTDTLIPRCPEMISAHSYGTMSASKTAKSSSTRPYRS